ncbi:Deleted in malignant brain tumors 1 protein [Trichoplax sp. H2]|nr:Deleted in malignant brain tumors 1 protein [Trichoplax sp. H2]|eukprot:RDD41199.1 Deleted in malignant brain tumors 1 protein [Trichoplax sp. H2]
MVEDFVQSFHLEITLDVHAMLAIQGINAKQPYRLKDILVIRTLANLVPAITRTMDPNQDIFAFVKKAILEISATLKRKVIVLARVQALHVAKMGYALIRIKVTLTSVYVKKAILVLFVKVKRLISLIIIAQVPPLSKPINSPQVRLVGGRNRFEGRVEVLHNNKWGTICDNGWDLQDAKVVCRQLGFQTAVGKACCGNFGRGTGTVWLSNVNCTGYENSLGNCSLGTYGSNQCSHANDAGVMCTGQNINGDLRLVDSQNKNHKSGRVETFYNGTWGTICVGSNLYLCWLMINSTDACEVTPCVNGTCIQGSGKSFCACSPGYGGKLCQFKDSCATHPCPSNATCQNVQTGFSCKCPEGYYGRSCELGPAAEGDIHLANSTLRNSGRLEIFHNGIWGTICGQNFDMKSATVACRQLGYKYSQNFQCCGNNGIGNSYMWLDSVHCYGNETSLTNCPHSGWGLRRCSARNTVSVSCTTMKNSSCIPNRCVNGNCIEINNLQYSCNCSSGYTGVNCESENSCGSSPCSRGTCINAYPGYNCTCPIGWGGKICDMSISCSSSPCASNATCTNKLNGGYTCNCPMDFYGKNCEMGPADDYTIMISASNNPSSGLINIFFNSTWGTICDQNFDMMDAVVACRQLGYVTAAGFRCCAGYGQGNGPVFFTDFACKGNETQLSDCDHQMLLGSSAMCDHTKDVGIQCSNDPCGSSPCMNGKCSKLGDGFNCTCNVGFRGDLCQFIDSCTTQPCVANSTCQNIQNSHTCLCQSNKYGNLCQQDNPPQEGMVQLAGTTSATRGRVEIYHSGKWGSICGNNFTYSDAYVVCRQLGFSTAVSFTTKANTYGQGYGKIWLSYLRCYGNESSITSCKQRSQWGSSSCQHTQDAGVSCSKTICDSNPCDFGLCTSNATSYSCNCNFGFTGSRCELRDTCLSNPCPSNGTCTVNSNGYNCLCPQNSYGSFCQFRPLKNRAIRLVGGTVLSGRLEIYYNNSWGTVCDRNFSRVEGDVACREMGYARAGQVRCCGAYGAGQGPVWLDEVKCNGNESTLASCKLGAWGNKQCDHRRDVGLICQRNPCFPSSPCLYGSCVVNGNSYTCTCYPGFTGINCNTRINHCDANPCPNNATCSNFNDGYRCLCPGISFGERCQFDQPKDYDITLDYTHAPGQGYLLVYLNQTWGRICFDGYTRYSQFNNEIICRQLGYTSFENWLAPASFTSERPIIMNDLYCKGIESKISQCEHSKSNVGYCTRNRNRPIGVKCSDHQCSQNNHCNHGYCIILSSNTYSCVCEPGWTGQHCLTNINECASNPCGNSTSMICSDLINNYGCSCVSGRSGYKCMFDSVAIGVRLVGGNHNFEGRVEVYYNSQWGTICNDKWSINNANVICRQLGFSGAASVPSTARYGYGSGIIGFDDIQCSGNETTITKCPHRSWGISNCGHSEDAAVVCIDKPMNAMTPPQPHPETCITRPQGLRLPCDDRPCDRYNATCVNINNTNSYTCRCQMGFFNGSSCISKIPYSLISFKKIGSLTSPAMALVCIVGGHPKPKIHVYKGNKPVTSDGIVTTSAFSFDKIYFISTVNLTSVISAHYGRYTCRVTSSSQNITSKAIVIDPLIDDSKTIHQLIITISGVCDSSPCGNNGYCRSSADEQSYKCLCYSGFTGTNCQKANVTNRYPCDNTKLCSIGKCTNVYNGTSLTSICKCDIGQTNPSCYRDKVTYCRDPCMSSPCNNGYCYSISFGTSYRCSCKSGFTGKTCNVQMTVPSTPVVNEPKIRLAGGYNRFEGRVEVFRNGRWGTICDDGWDLTDAMVVCRQLGFTNAIGKGCCGQFGFGTGQIWLSKVNCYGNEGSLSTCNLNWGSTGNCSHRNDAGVICIGPNRNGDTRLVDVSNDHKHGRVEVFYNGTWGTVCSDGFELTSAHVVCKQLGFYRASTFSRTSENSPAYQNVPIVLDNVHCTGTELSISQCSNTGWLVANGCTHHKDVEVTCQDACQVAKCVNGQCVEQFNTYKCVCQPGWAGDSCELRDNCLSHPCSANATCLNNRFGYICQCPTSFYGKNCELGPASNGDVHLVNGSQPNIGRLEMYNNGIWGTVCGTNFDQNDTMVVCRQLGYKFAWYSRCCGVHGAGNNYMWLDSVHCKGAEPNLLACEHSGLGLRRCNPSSTVSVACLNDACLSSPCWNGVCISTPTGHTCNCYAGWTGLNCATIGTQNNTCATNPCLNGNCINTNNGNNFTCQCQGGYTGRRCETENRCLLSPCANGTCTPRPGGFTCTCLSGWTGAYCNASNSCASSPCSANATCQQNIDGHQCLCTIGYYGSVCQYGPAADGSLRLVGNMANRGLLEVYRNGMWGSVCDAGFGYMEAMVACRQLGYNTAVRVRCCALFGKSTGPILLANINCTGTEQSLLQCTYENWTSSMTACTHSKDVGIQCSDDYCASSPCVSGSCNSLINGYNCSCLTGYRGKRCEFIDGCSGSPCSTNATCQNIGNTFRCLCPGTSYGSNCANAGPPANGVIQLAGSAQPDQGRVEVYYNGSWGTICDNNFDFKDATVICHQLGYLTALTAGCCPISGQGTGSVWLSNLQCDGTESTISSCKHNGWGNNTCANAKDASVTCTSTT